MSQLLPTARGWPPQPELGEVRVPTTEGWVADMSDTAEQLVQVSEMRDWRKQLWGYETRSGYREWLAGGKPVINIAGPGSTPGKVPLWTDSFRIDETVINITFYWDGLNVGAVFVDPVANKLIDQALVIVGGTKPIVCSRQYGTFMLFSIMGNGTYQMGPTDLVCSGWTPPILLGKAICPTPSTTRWTDTTTGNLLVYDGSNKPPDDGSRDVFLKNIFYDPLQPDARVIPMPIKATYYSVQGSFFEMWVHGGSYPLYERNKTDIKPAAHDNNPQQCLLHNPTRAYGYRFVAVQTFTDVKGQKYTTRSFPSTDYWVPSAYFAPAQILPPYGNTSPNYGSSSFVWWSGIGGVTPDSIVDRDFISNGATGALGCSYVPDRTSFFDLVGLFRAAVHDNVHRPWLFASYYFGARQGDDDLNAGPDYQQHQPFKPYVTGHELKKAPLTLFEWGDFAGLPAGTTEIEIYRTAYSYPDDADNASKSPLFEPHQFGYVGSVKPGASFTDDISDDSLDFTADNPERWNGYLAGDFSGQVMRVYDDKVVLGNTTTSSHLLAPIPEMVIAGPPILHTGSVIFSSGYTEHELFAFTAGDGLPQTTFYIQYVDNIGRVSAATLVTPMNPNPGGVHGLYFTLPRGYTPSITSVNILKGYWDPTANGGKGARRFLFITTVPVTQGVYVADAQETGTPIDPSALFATVTTSVDPGMITWSDPDDINQWQIGNSEVHHQFAGVTYMETTLGPLYIYTDQSITKTDLQGRFEEDHAKLGAIGRQCATKYDKVVLFLSQNGLCITEGSAQRIINGNIHSEVLRYLAEEIPGQPPLANARRADLKLLGRGRQEIWLHFPSSADLWPAGATYPAAPLPARTFIYREFEFTALTRLVNYEFTLNQTTATSDPELPVYLCEHTDGRLMSSHLDPDRGLVIQDNDTDVPWIGDAALEIRLGLGNPMTTKRLSRLWWWGEALGLVQVATGIQRADGLRDPVTGWLSQVARLFKVTVLGSGAVQAFLHKIKLTAPAEETTARVPLVRWVTEPDEEGRHMVRIRAIRVKLIQMSGNNR